MENKPRRKTITILMLSDAKAFSLSDEAEEAYLLLWEMDEEQAPLPGSEDVYVLMPFSEDLKEEDPGRESSGSAPMVFRGGVGEDGAEWESHGPAEKVVQIVVIMMVGVIILSLIFAVAYGVR